MQTRIYQRAARTGSGAQLYYNLLCDFNGQCPAYGAEIILEGDGRYESAAISALTTSRQRMESLLAQLCRSTVYPHAMQAAVEEAWNLKKCMDKR